MKNWLYISLMICGIVFSCTTVDCEEFDLDREIMQFYMFPTGLDQYVYTNGSGDSIVFNQVAYNRSEFYENQCHMCSCNQVLDATYRSESQNLEVRNVANYDTELFPDWEGGTNYYFGAPASFFTMREDSLYEEFSEVAGDTAHYMVRNKLSLRIANTPYVGVIELIALDTSNTLIQTVWIEKANGLIGFRYNNVEWRRIN